MRGIRFYLIVILFAGQGFFSSVKALSCISLGQLDLYEYISADIIAEIDVVSFSDKDHQDFYTSEVNIRKVYRGFKGLPKSITIKGSNNSGTYAPRSGSMLIWAYKNSDGTYSTNACTRSFRLSTESNFINRMVNLFKSKWKHRKQLLFLGKYKSKSEIIKVSQDGLLIEGRLKCGWPIGVWKITSKNNEIITYVSYKNGIKDGEKHVINSYEQLLYEQSFFRDGLKDGISYKMYNNGYLKSIMHYSLGKKHGSEVYYNKDKTLSYRGENSIDYAYGTWYYYSPTQQLEKKIIYTPRDPSINHSAYDSLY